MYLKIKKILNEFGFIKWTNSCSPTGAFIRIKWEPSHTNWVMKSDNETMMENFHAIVQNVSAEVDMNPQKLQCPLSMPGERPFENGVKFCTSDETLYISYPM